jgi:hypothetical protein
MEENLIKELGVEIENMAAIYRRLRAEADQIKAAQDQVKQRISLLRQLLELEGEQVAATQMEHFARS